MIDMKIKSLFFDRKVVMDAMSRATRNVLAKFGAFVRRGARSSIRKRKASSIPGAPPSSHTGLLRDNIFFGYDAENMSVVIGPVLVGAKGKAASGTVPQIIEEGGETVIIVGHRPARTVAVEARPYMSPAFAREIPKLAGMWKDAVTS